MSDSIIDAKYAALRAGFLQRTTEVVTTTEGAWVVHSTAQSHQALTAIYQIAHRLADSGGTFGCPEIGAIALRLVNALLPAIDAKAAPKDPAAIVAIIHELRSAATSSAVDAATIDTSGKRPAPETASIAALDLIPPRLLYLVDDDEHLAEYLRQQIRNFGYEVAVFHDFATARDAILRAKPQALLLDVAFPEAEFAGPDFALSLRAAGITDIPILFMSGRADTATRLRAVRAGGSAFFPKPIVLTDVVSWLDSVTLPAEPEPSHILIVEDQVSTAMTYAAYLTSAGMESANVSDPMKVLDELAKFNPDFILLDMYMPGASGEEIARVIRQTDAYLSVPIVFLSGENNADKQLQAIKLGGDAFLTKPIEGTHLIGAVTSRAARYKALRGLTDRDGLTGLVNRRKFDEHLAIELSRAQRQKRPLTLAVIDLDHFKMVNDAHGHACGDRVLRNLARQLVKGLRRTDIAARFGGEEFCVLLTDVDVATAQPVMDRLRESFAKIQHESGTTTFSCTFSAGLADSLHFSTPKLLFEAADQALYDAKHLGRNRLARTPARE